MVAATMMYGGKGTQKASQHTITPEPRTYVAYNKIKATSIACEGHVLRNLFHIWGQDSIVHSRCT